MNLLTVAQYAAEEAVKIAFTFLDDPDVISDNEKDIKTLADEKMNEVIIQHLQPTGIAIVSEEIKTDEVNLPEKCWIIDPLDGTYNFSRKYPCAAVSICLWEKGEPVLGIIKDIFYNQSYSFSIDQPSQLQNDPMHVSGISEIDKAILATGFPSGASYETSGLMAFVASVQAFKKIRALGSASLMLAHVATGVFDVYYEKNIYLWDVAAGLGLVKNAGGDFIIRRNGTTAQYEVLASNKNLFTKAKTLLIKEQT